jgi:pimeloyl-ACP methyl ester carboxylesterase
MCDEGLVTIKSRRAVKDMIESIEGQLAEKGINMFARVDHVAVAALIDMSLRPTLLLMFGSPVGKAVVLIHGYTDNARDWVPLAPYLSRDLRLILSDIRGHGQSSKP